MTSINSSKAANQSIHRVIEVIRAHREVSRRLISKETGLSTPSITRLVNELMESDVLCVHESTTVDGAGPGRPASVVKLNPLFGCAIGVDVGEHVIQIALGDMSGKIQLTSRLPTAAETGGNATFANIVRAINDICGIYKSSFEQDAPPLRAITVGVPGTVDPKTSHIAKAPKINGWTDFDLKGRLESEIPGIAIRIVNDINAAATAESAHGVAKGYDNFVFASIRRGIGAGIFINGQLYQGSAGFAGEMGKMVFDADFKFSAAEGTGHLETICGEDPVLDLAIAKGIELESTESSRPRMRSLATAAANGNQDAIEVLQQFLTNYGLAVANIASLLDPSIIVIGGEIYPVMDMAVEHLTKTIALLIPSPPKIVGSTLGERAILQGTYYQAHKDACDTMLVDQSDS
ncbi:ROK family transcriptional regulator [Mariniblastus fucicola]|uniref:N-acetylglucosamine repressor n=1 Tax=Mariniblastus fucicola TaxID=980251 RepID=A0A5B9P740_9BACT|nr:ROK family transcriptional regulator [Mariniblastus fucicola]QEG21369.1 N-acetylglucosamine repressor [Mariniblastus fucicola]